MRAAGQVKRAGAETAAHIGPVTVQMQNFRGFLRDDAILVITVISDDPPSSGDSAATDVMPWVDAVLDAKNGDPGAVVVLGLVP